MNLSAQVPNLNDSGTYYDRLKSYFLQYPITPADTAEGGIKEDFRRAAMIWAPRLWPHGDAKKGATAFNNYVANYNNGGGTQLSLNTTDPFWTPLGPIGNVNEQLYTGFNGNGQIHRLTFHPNYNNTTNKQIFACSGYGGLWKTANNGTTWTLLNTDKLPYCGVSDVAIDFQNPANMYIATGNPDNGFVQKWSPNWGTTNPLYTAGVYKSINGGATWAPMNGGNLLSYFAPDGGIIAKMAINPTDGQKLFFVSSKGVFRTINAKSNSPTWAQVFLGLNGNDMELRGLEFMPANSSTVYVSGTDIYRSTQNGDAGTWTSMTGPGTGLNLNALPNSFKVLKINIAVTLADPDRLYALIIGNINNTNSTRNYAYMFDNGTWSKLYQEDGYDSPGWLAIAASPTIASEVYFVANDNIKGTDDVYNLVTHPISITAGYGGIGVHADIHDFEFQPNISSPKLFFAHDGGVSFKTTLPTYNNTNGWVFKNNGIDATLIWAFDDADYDKNTIIIGLQDNGANVYFDNPGVYDWYRVSGSDGHNARINDVNKDDMLYMNYETAKKFNGALMNSTGVSLPIDPTSGSTVILPKTMPMVNDVNDIGLPHIGAAEILNWPSNPGNSNNFIIQSDLGKSEPNQDLRRATEIAIAPSNPNYVYVVTAGSDEPVGSQWGDLEPKLFRSTTGFSNGFPLGPKVFDDLSANLPKLTNPGTGLYTPPITGIAINPSNHLDVWLSFTGYDATIKVWRSLDGGLTWTNQDPNNSLNNLPVNAIVYQPGTNDRVYIGTDAGIFYKDATMASWLRYGDEFPRVRVTELKINNCSGKLRAATYGRGLWEGNLLGELGESGLTRTISINTTISTTDNARGHIFITNGATLTITGQLNMPFNGKIIVDRGAKLLVNGGTITNDCGYMWLGVEVWGNKNKIQNNTWQGYVVMQNGGTITNARNAISTIKNTNGVWDWNYTGGVLQCSNSTFKNNARDVQFLSYKAPTIQIPYDPNKSYFNNCTFICDNKLQDPNYVDQYNNPVATPYHVTMFDVDGIDFNGCTFKTDLTNFNFNEDVRGIGIYAEEAGFYVGNLANDRGQFQNLTVGIWAKTLTGATYINTRIKDNDFDNVRQGIVQNVGFCDMTGNVFTNMVPSTTNGLDATGILMDNAKGFIIADNNQMFATPGNVWGVDVKGSGMYGGTICRNSFTGINWANQFEQSNEKLKTSCNTYTANYRALHLSASGLLGDQGEGCATADDRPNNTFNTNTLSILNSSLNNFAYYSWHNPPNPPNFDYPAGVTGLVTVNTCNGIPGTNDPSSVCGVTCGPCYGLGCVIASKIAYQNDSNPDTKELACNRIINYYAYTNEDESLDSTIYLDSGNVAVKRLMVANYIGKRNGTVAQALLNTMSASNNEDAKFASYYNILINLINNNKRWDQVTTWQRNTITTIANSGTKIAPVALAYLEFLNKSFSFRTNAVEGFAKQTILQNIDYVNATMLASPNPFSDVTVIKVSIPPSQLWTMKVMDITGRIMVKTQLVAGKYELPISANELNGNGLYFCQLLCDDKPIETIKIICLK
nr:T9SS type A sorting domain-containing protein [Bacteroidota bacterium]